MPYITDANGNYVPVASTKGEDGKEVELRVNAGYIQWRREDTEWANLIAVESLRGEPGKKVQLSASGYIIKWKYEGDTTWTELCDFTNFFTSLSAAESARVNAENARASAESARVAGETARANAETSRQSAEQSRFLAETNRASAEQTRQNQESARQANTATAIQDANDATDRANTAAEACEDIVMGAIPSHAETHATGGGDAISPTSIGAAAAIHAHGNLTSSGAVGSAANMPLITGANGVVQPTTADNMLQLLKGLKVYTSIPNSDLNSCLDNGIYVSAPDGLLHLPRAGLDDAESPFMMIVFQISSMGQSNVQQLFFHDAGGPNNACLAGRTKNEYDDWTDWSIFASEATVTQLVELFMSKTTYGGSADGVVKSADKLQTPRYIGNAKFDGTKDVYLSNIGAEIATTRIVSSYGGSYTLTLQGHKEFVFNEPLTDITVKFPPSASFDSWCRFTAGNSINVIFPQNATFIGGVPTFEPNKTYEMSIKDGCVVCAEVVSA